jgi:hypothetical protein
MLPLLKANRPCKCGRIADKYGDHADGCRLLNDYRTDRHNMVRDTTTAIVAHRQEVEQKGFSFTKEPNVVAHGFPLLPGNNGGDLTRGDLAIVNCASITAAPEFTTIVDFGVTGPYSDPNNPDNAPIYGSGGPGVEKGKQGGLMINDKRRHYTTLFGPAFSDKHLCPAICESAGGMSPPMRELLQDEAGREARGAEKRRKRQTRMAGYLFKDKIGNRPRSQRLHGTEGSSGLGNGPGGDNEGGERDDDNNNNNNNNNSSSSGSKNKHNRPLTIGTAGDGVVMRAKSEPSRLSWTRSSQDPDC